MKLTPRTKKILTVIVLLLAVSTLTGCSIPRDEAGNIILITNETTFSDVMSSENWFSAILVFPLSKLINWLSPVISVGGAIALITLLVNGIVVALPIKSNIQSQQMQLIQPELNKIQRKYEGRDDDASKMRQAAEMQALYKKYDINPASMILITFLQLPIMMAMFYAVQRSEAVQTGSFLGMNLQNTPLQAFQSLMSGDTSGLPYILLFVFMGVCQFLSMSLPQWLQKKRAEAEAAKHHRKPEEPSKQGQFMQYYMLVMICGIGIMWPAAMSLYWAINSVVNISKTFVVQQIIDKKNAEKGTRR